MVLRFWTKWSWSLRNSVMVRLVLQRKLGMSPCPKEISSCLPGGLRLDFSSGVKVHSHISASDCSFLRCTIRWTVFLFLECSQSKKFLSRGVTSCWLSDMFSLKLMSACFTPDGLDGSTFADCLCFVVLSALIASLNSFSRSPLLDP